MAKKIASKLITTDHVIYAVLCEGKGFMKELYGQVHFDDNLPRASGCFVTKQEAIAAHQRALELTRKEVEVQEDGFNKADNTASQRDGWEYFVDQARERFKQAQDAIVVEIAIRGVV